jgi:hypothetical protein
VEAHLQGSNFWLKTLFLFSLAGCYFSTAWQFPALLGECYDTNGVFGRPPIQHGMWKLSGEK